MISPEQFEEICLKIETNSFGITSILNTFFPKLHKEQFYRFMRSDDKYRDRYARAKELQADFIAEEILEIADDGTNDYMTVIKGDNEYEVEDKERVNRSRIRIDSRKWLLSKLLPKKYGEKLEVDNTHRFPDKINIKFED